MVLSKHCFAMLRNFCESFCLETVVQSAYQTAKAIWGGGGTGGGGVKTVCRWGGGVRVRVRLGLGLGGGGGGYL